MTLENDTINIGEKILSQINYYFSDYNLSRDVFLLNKMKENNEGWISIDTLIKFNRLNQICDQPDLILKELSQIIKLKNSDVDKGFLVVDMENRQIKRNNDEYPIPKDFKNYFKKLINHSIYAKGFPKNSTLDEISKYFATNFGPVLNVYLRYYIINDKKTKSMQSKNDGNVNNLQSDNKTKTFKGSVFATFENECDANKFLETPTLYKGKELIKMYKHLYEAQKKLEYEERKNSKKDKNPMANGTEDDKKIVSDRVQQLIQKGNILHIVGFDVSDDKTTRHTLKEVFDTYSKVAWIEFEPGDKQAYIRFTGEENVAKLVLDKLKAEIITNDEQVSDNIIKNDVISDNCDISIKNNTGDNDKKIPDINDSLTKCNMDWKLNLGENYPKLQCRILKNDEEFNYWVGIVDKITKSSNNNNNFNKKKGKKNKQKGNFNNKKNFTRKRKGEESNTNVSKIQKTD
ncbi:unnamed protein product [Gordionus sp. m RMFG-2023]|uniref:lupus La protein homolog n=1 Tax=Gordionus sp. m RMFG-2023 TaxID=3053472 RepID=UPI0030E2E643